MLMIKTNTHFMSYIYIVSTIEAVDQDRERPQHITATLIDCKVNFQLIEITFMSLRMRWPLTLQ